jgi:Lycopene cyclase
LSVAYPYLLSELAGLPVVCLALAVARAERTLALACGASMVLCSPLSLLHEGHYWTPGRLFGGGWGIEDVLFCLRCGVLASIGMLWPWRHLIQMRPTSAVALRRWVGCTAVSGALLVSLMAAGFSVMLSFILAQAMLCAFIAGIRTDYLRLVLAGATIFPLYYFLHLHVLRLLLPGFMQMWNGTQLIDAHLLDVPIEEYLWVISFSACAPLVMAYVFNVQVASPVALRVPQLEPDATHHRTETA